MDIETAVSRHTSVTWTSQAGGHTKVKTGKALATIKAGEPAYKTLSPSNVTYKTINLIVGDRTLCVLRSHVQFDSLITTYDRILVEVPRKGAGAGLHDYYAPSLTVVMKQNPESDDPAENNDSTDDETTDLLRHGRRVLAVKAYRETTGASLQAAIETVDAMGIMPKPGQVVTWTSQSGGCSKTKTGKALAILPGRRPFSASMLANLIGHVGTLPGSRIKFDDVSQNDRVLVEVPRKSGVCDYYAPLLTVIMRQNPGAK